MLRLITGRSIDDDRPRPLVSTTDHAYAIVTSLEESTALRVTRLWKILAERDADGRVKFSDEQIRVNYRPHVTLAVVDDAAGPDILVAPLKGIVAAWKPLPIMLDSISILPKKPVAPMLLRPNVTSEFLNLNREVCGALPSNWISSSHKPEV